jgi:ubiquinone/menaquinone biosynthesis C-methylase UbiE
MTRAILEAANLRGQRVLDIGCGDGVYTAELYDLGQPAILHGLDPAVSGISAARVRAGTRLITLGVGSAYALPYSDDTFDWAVLRGVLHHLERPIEALSEALRVSQRIVVVEPNGLNPILKVLERVSPYHITHGERSFLPRTLDAWVETQGGRVTWRQWVGVVPMFCPRWFARCMKSLEPMLERLPLVRSIGCGQYVFAAERRTRIARVRRAG